MISQNFNDWLNYMHAIQGSGVMMHPVEGEVTTPVKPEPEPEPEPDPESENPEESETEESTVDTQAAKKSTKKKITE